VDTQTLNPSIDLINDFQALQVTIFEDEAGEKTRRMVEYFKQAETSSRGMELRTQDFEQKRFAKMLHEAFGACSRIVLAAWQKAHGTELVA
jgi:hypothetical protein